MICSTLLPLTPKSLPPFGGQTQPAHVLLKFADSRRALLTVQRHGFMVAPDACGRSGCSLEYAVRVVDHFEFRAHVFGLSQAGLMEADVTVETLGVGVESGDPQGEPIVADGALARLNQRWQDSSTYSEASSAASDRLIGERGVCRSSAKPITWLFSKATNTT